MATPHRATQARADEIAGRLADVQARLVRAAWGARRDPATVTLVAVSKTHPAEDIRAAYEAGQRDFGENYAQELVRKREQLADLADLRWHFIGALQSNKARLLVPGCALFHAVDRPSVAEALGKRALATGQVAELCLEVNVGGEASKAGVPPAEAEALLETVAQLGGVRARGLTCVPPPSNEEAQLRLHFKSLRDLRDRLRARRPELEDLSMGMSGDYPLAIAEGATHVRVGTAIFGERPPRS
jgi:hypothetical protein